MNFYKHHIGDYAQATAHLSFVEDAAYSRMIRKYYAEEKPLPADIKAIQRLIGARTREEKQAVEDILREFFTQESDGWHNKRCDSELERANAQAETNRRIAEEREAKRRARMEDGSSTIRQYSQNGTSNDSLHDSSASREPSQTPDSRHQTPEINPPIPPKGGNPAIEFKTFVAKCKESGEKLISDYRPVFDYAEKVQLPIAMVQLCWDEFQRRYSPGGPSESKRYKDWRKVFRNCVEGNWLKLWWLNPATDAFELTTAGRTAGRNAA